MAGIVYDTGALIAAERRDVRLWALHRATLTAGVRPVVPVVVLAQGWRGGPQALMSRLLASCDVRADDEVVGRAAGRACALSGTGDVVDAIVVVTALRYGAAIVTTDPKDLLQLSAALDAELTLTVL